MCDEASAIINKLIRIGVNLSVRVSVCNGCHVTSSTCTLGTRLYKVCSNAYAGNESPKTVGAIDAGQLYRAIATVTGGL